MEREYLKLLNNQIERSKADTLRMNLNANYTKIKNRKKQNKEDPCTVKINFNHFRKLLKKTKKSKKK